MRPLKGDLLLKAWERGSAEPGPNRALALLSVALDDAGMHELAALGLADCDMELLRLRRISFGDALRGLVPCRSCSTRVEFEISVTSMLERLEVLRPANQATWTESVGHFTMRPVTTSDLMGIAATRNPRRRLLARCTSVQGADVESALETCEDRATEQ